MNELLPTATKEIVDKIIQLRIDLAAAQKARDDALAKVEEFEKEVMPRSEFLDLLEERDSLRKWRDETYKAWQECNQAKAEVTLLRSYLDRIVRGEHVEKGGEVSFLEDGTHHYGHATSLAKEALASATTPSEEIAKAQALIKRLQESLVIEHEIAIEAIANEMEKPLLTMFQKCIEGHHDQCIGQSDKLFRSGKLAKCSCDCHKPLEYPVVSEGFIQAAKSVVDSGVMDKMMGPEKGIMKWLCLLMKLTVLAFGLGFVGVAVYCAVKGDLLTAAIWMLCAHCCVDGIVYRQKS